MVSPRAKRFVVNGALGVLCVGIPVFAVTYLYPTMARHAGNLGELRTAQQSLSLWSHKAFPTQTRIETEESLKAGLQAEAERVRTYYQSRNALLRRSLLESYSGDPVTVKLKYQELKRQWETKSRYQYARDILGTAFVPAYPWEEAGKMPARNEFRPLEKRACVTDVVVGMMAGAPCAMGRIAVGEPAGTAAPGIVVRETAEAPAGTATEGSALPYVAWPVSVDLVCSFRQLAAVLDKAVTPPADYPCVLLRTLNVQAVPSPRTPAEASQVVVKLSLDVLEFK